MTILNKIAMSIFFISGLSLNAASLSSLRSMHVIEGDFAAQAVLSFSGPVSCDQDASDDTYELRMHISPAVCGDLSSDELIHKFKSLRIDEQQPVQNVSVAQHNDLLEIRLAFAPEQVLVKLDNSEDSHDIVVAVYSKQKLAEKNNTLDGPLYLAANDDRFVPALYQKKKSDGRRKLCIVIDAGHGGTANGAVGLHALVEKDLTLDVAKRVYAQLKKAGHEVHLTRKSDTAINLYDRVAFAQERRADLFVSIHANSAGSSAHAHGIETFCCNGESLWKLKTMNGKPRLLFAHNSKKSVNIAGHLDRLKSFFSFHLAESLQSSLLKVLKLRKPPVVDRGVKQAGFVVLERNLMPAALVEIGFVTNPHEARYLASTKYRSLLAYGISRGIHDFVRNHG